jgi:hypothetical protein
MEYWDVDSIQIFIRALSPANLNFLVHEAMTVSMYTQLKFQTHKTTYMKPKLETSGKQWIPASTVGGGGGLRCTILKRYSIKT